MFSLGMMSLIVFGPLATYMLALAPILWWTERGPGRDAERFPRNSV